LSLGRAARLAEMDVSELVTQLPRLGIALVSAEADAAAADLDTIDSWLASS
jgi:predicted HTH domain antitoxin